MLISRRQLLLLAGCGWASLKAQTSVVCPGFELPDLQQKTLLVPKVDANGRVISQEEASASFFLEDLGEGVTLEMVAIPGGRFDMGSDQIPEAQPVHSVTVPPYFLGAFEVTRGQWRRALTFPKVQYDMGYLARSSMPEQVENSLPVDSVVFFFRAEEFCARLARLTGRPYRLPSEAEWEYACRAGTTTAYHFGDAISLDVANYNDGVYRPVDLTPVGSKNAPNAFGLHDMHGNVAEWCLDWEHRNYQGAPMDGSPWVGSGKSNGRVIRGGMFGWNEQVARSAARMFWLWEWAASGIGFRVALGPCTQLSRPRRRP